MEIFRGVEGFKPNFSGGGRSMDIFRNNTVSVERDTGSSHPCLLLCILTVQSLISETIADPILNPQHTYRREELFLSMSFALKKSSGFKNVLIFAGFSLRILVAGDRCKFPGEYCE